MENADPLNVSASLTRNAIKREFFDPSNKNHVESFKQYINQRKWGNVQFMAEPPFLTVEQTVLNKFAYYALNEI